MIVSGCARSARHESKRKMLADTLGEGGLDASLACVSAKHRAQTQEGLDGYMDSQEPGAMQDEVS